MAELSIYSILIILNFLTILLGENSYMQKMRMDVDMGIHYHDLEYILNGENGAFPPTRDGCIHSLSMRERG